jgi:RimJ/RimL family protein N-acetyltransferase
VIVDAMIPYPEPPLAGAAFVLRRFRADDFAAASELGEDAATARWVPALPAADGGSVVEFFEQSRKEGGWLHLVIADASSDAYLGEVMAVVGEGGVGELGCGVIPAARGRGIATEALRLLAEWALHTVGVGRLQVFVAPENIPALRLAESAGFRREGLLRSYWDDNGTRLDAVVLSRLPGDEP